MYMYLCVYTYICMYMYIHIKVYMYARTSMGVIGQTKHICIFTYGNRHNILIHLCVCTHTQMDDSHAFMYIHTRTHTQAKAYACTHRHIHMYTLIYHICLYAHLWICVDTYIRISAYEHLPYALHQFSYTHIHGYFK